MPNLTKDQLLAKVKSVLGDNTSDEAIGLIEDITDTYDDLDGRAKDTTDWKQKYEENDAQWRKKYTDRFYNGAPAEGDKPDDGGEETVPPEQLSFDSLFEENKNK